MAVAVDSEMAGNVGADSGAPVSPFTFSFNNAAGTLLVLVVGIGVGGGDPAPVFNSVTYDSVAMTLLVSKTTAGANGGKIAIYYLLSPATGNKTVGVDFSWPGSHANSGIFAGCTSFTGNDTSSPFAQNTSDAGSTATSTLALNGCVAGNMTICGHGGGSDFTSGNQTKTWSKNINGFTAMNNGWANRAASSGTVTHTATMSGSDSWAAVMAEIQVPAVVGASIAWIKA